MAVRDYIGGKLQEWGAKMMQPMGGVKSASRLPLRFEVDGKTYFINSQIELQKLVGKITTGEYSDYNLVCLYYSIAEIFAPIAMIANAVSSGKFELKKTKDDSVVYDNKYINNLLASPNPLQNWQQFMFEATVWMYVNGKNYIYANTPDTLSVNYRNISTLTNLYSYAVEPVCDTYVKLWSATTISDIIKGYNINDGTPTIPTEKVLFQQFMSLNNNDKKIDGKSPLLSARKAIDNLSIVYDARNSIYTSRGALGMLTNRMSDAGGFVALTPDEKKQVISDYNSTYGITGGRSPVGITQFPLDYLKIGMSISELMPFEEAQATTAAIYSVLDVPFDLMPNAKGTTFDNQKMAQRALYQRTAIPVAKQYAQSLTTFLKLEEVGLYLDVNFDHIEVLQGNRKEKAETEKIENESLSIQFQNGVITLNDWISKTGGKPVANNLYNKRLLEMTPEQVTFVLSVIKNKPVTNEQPTG
jgi:phage portal protein BeeE